MLIKNIRVDSHFPEQLEGDVYFPLFNKDIGVQGFTSDSIEYANECAKLLTNLNDHLIAKLCQASIKYCNNFLDAIGEETKHFENEKDILALIYPSVLIVDDGESKPVIHLELNCEWEEEHGMEWVVRDDEVQYVSSFNGVSPFDDFTEKEEWNFA